MDDVIVRIQEGLPLSVRAFTMLDAEGDYNVYINAKLSYEQMRESFQHELTHITNNDFYSSLSATAIEKARRGA